MSWHDSAGLIALIACASVGYVLGYINGSRDSGRRRRHETSRRQEWAYRGSHRRG